MQLAELQKALRKADPAAVLVSPRILERVIREVCVLPSLYWSVPHALGFVVDRQLLFRHAEQADLEVGSDQLLPDTVILLARPDVEELSGPESKPLLLKYWRRLFHCSVHVALGGHAGDNPLTPEAVRERIGQLGRTEFEEVRRVLVQDDYLPPGADERATWVEFAALFLELRYFAPALLPTYFPGIRDLGKVELLLARDVDGAALFARTRLAGAADPGVPVESRSDDSAAAYWALVRSAERAALDGNPVRAAIVRTRAARIAPAAQTASTRIEAEADVRRLTARLAPALQLREGESGDWAHYLTLLLDKADQGQSPVEAQLLYDLQKVCDDHERDIYALDLVEWALSGGKRPIKRPLPSQRLVRIIKHLRSAAGRLAAVRLSDADRKQFAALLQAALHAAEQALRARLGPVLTTAMEDVGLRPRTPPERAAFDKMVQELLDRITDFGFITFADLRDTISRNKLKLPDLDDPQDFVRGDPLLRLDRRLGSLLDGVYRPSEIYMRWLERLTALNFGTPTGRAITRFFTIPFGSALLLVLAAEMVLGHVLKRPALDPRVAQAVAAQTAAAPGIDQSSVLQAVISIGVWGLDGSAQAQHLATQAPVIPVVAQYVSVGLLGLLILALMQLEGFRVRCREGLLLGWRALRFAFVELPVRAVPLRWLNRLITSWGFQLIYWYLLKPAAVWAMLVWFWPKPFAEPWVSAVVFCTAVFLLNSRAGRAAADVLTDGAASLGQQIRAGLLPGLVRLVVRAFKRSLEALEYLLFTVDEWLRFRAGDSRLSLVLRTLVGVVWFPISYVARFYTVVLIEPCLNPLKLPLCILAAKFVYPLLAVWEINGKPLFNLRDLSSPLVGLLQPYMGYAVAWVFVIGTFYLLPDAFGFLVWELKENWSLYRANRGKAVGPVPVGVHGETVRALLQPGFHSGTVPRLYARLREAERSAHESGDWHAARRYREQLAELAGALRRFVDRELVSLLRQSNAWGGQPVETVGVQVTINRVRFELTDPAFPARALEVELKLREGWLVAGLGERGWLDRLGPRAQRAFAAVLANLYKLAGIDLVMEQMRANLPPTVAGYDLTAAGLVLRPACEGRSVTFDLKEGPAVVEGGGPAGWPMPDARRLIFTRRPLLWDEWVAFWERDRDGKGDGELPEFGLELLGLPADGSAATPERAGGPEVAITEAVSASAPPALFPPQSAR
jgi:hypothetical protein